MRLDCLYAEKAGIDPAVARTALAIVNRYGLSDGVVSRMVAMHNLLTAYGYKPVRRPAVVIEGFNFSFVWLETTY